MTDALLSYLAQTGYYRRGYAMAIVKPKTCRGKMARTCKECGQTAMVQSRLRTNLCRSCANKHAAAKRWNKSKGGENNGQGRV